MFLTEPGARLEAINPQNSLSLSLPVTTHMHMSMPGFYMGTAGLNSGLCACRASILLPIEPSSQPVSIEPSSQPVSNLPSLWHS